MVLCLGSSKRGGGGDETDGNIRIMCEEKQSWRNMTAEKATKRHRLQGNRELSGRRFREGVPYLLRKKIYIQRTMYGSELVKHGAYKPNWPKRYKLGQRCCWGLPFPPFSGRASRKFREIRARFTGNYLVCSPIPPLHLFPYFTMPSFQTPSNVEPQPRLPRFILILDSY